MATPIVQKDIQSMFKIKIFKSSFKSREHVQKKEPGPYFEFCSPRM